METLKALTFVLRDGSTPSDGSAPLVPTQQPREIPLGIDLAIPFRSLYSSKLPADLTGWLILFTVRDAETGTLLLARSVASGDIDPTGTASAVKILRADTGPSGLASSPRPGLFDLVAVAPNNLTWRGVEPSAWVPVPSEGDPDEPFTPPGATQALFGVPPLVAGRYLTNDGLALSWGTLNALPSQAGQTGKFLTTDGTTASWAASSGGITSVGLTAPSFLSVAGSPITSAGTLAISLATQSANLIFAGPTSGAAAAPTFRSLVAADIPAIAESGVTGLVADLAAKATDSLVVHLAGAESITGAKTFKSATLLVRNAADTFTTTLASAASAARTWTLPDASDTAVGLVATQTLTNKTLSAGVLAGAFTTSGGFSLSGAFGDTISVSDVYLDRLAARVFGTLTIGYNASQITTQVKILPSVDGSQVLGDSTHRFGDVQANAINVSVASGNGSYVDLANGVSAGVSAAGHIRFRSNAGVAEVSSNGGAFAAIGTGAGTVTSVSGTAPIAVATGTTTPVISINNTAVTPASYGDASNVGAFTVDAQGRLTAASSTAILIAESQVTGLVADLAAKAQGNDARLPPAPSTQGRVLYDSGSAWTALGVGTSGQVLTTQGASANPAWASVVTSAIAGGGVTVSAATGAVTLGTDNTVVALLAGAQSFSGAKTFLNGTLLARNAANTFSTTFASAATAARTWTIPDATTTAAGLGIAQTFTKSQNVAPVALTDASNIATDSSLGNVFTVAPGGARTLGNPTNLVPGGTYLWLITQTGSGTLVYDTIFAWPSGAAPSLTVAAGAVDLITGVYDGSKVRGVFTADIR